jgi:hypothetical protein
MSERTQAQRARRRRAASRNQKRQDALRRQCEEIKRQQAPAPHLGEMFLQIATRLANRKPALSLNECGSTRSQGDETDAPTFLEQLGVSAGDFM